METRVANVGLDMAKSAFRVHGIDTESKVLLCAAIADGFGDAACSEVGDDILTAGAMRDEFGEQISRNINQLLQLRASRLETDETMRLIESAIRPEKNSAEDNSAGSCRSR